MDNTTHDFTTTRTRRGHTSSYAYHVVVEAAELPESVKKDRWYKVLAPFITKVERWSVQSDIGGHAHNWAELAKSIWPDRPYVIHTKFGTAAVVVFESCSALQGIMVRGSGRKSKAHTMGTWRKYGTKRGHGMAYLRAAAGMGLCSSPESGRDISEFEAVSYLAFGTFAEMAHAPTRALYAAVGA
jgi:hypothetical protein